MSPASCRAAPPRVACPTVHDVVSGPSRSLPGQSVHRETAPSHRSQRARAPPHRDSGAHLESVSVTGDPAMRTFAGRPQPVEIHHLGIWYSGELLGWRHEADGAVSARVRCVVDGLRHSTWKPLADLRLPDPKRPPRKEGRAAALGRPVAADPAADEFDDRTRPHALRAAPGVRPAKPE